MFSGFLIFLMLVSGISASILNKYIVTGLHITGKFFILFVQTAFLLSILFILNAFVFGTIAAKSVSVDAVLPWALPAVSLLIMIYSGLEANARLSISLFTVLKNLTIPVIAVHDTLFNNYQITRLTLLSFFLIVFSSFLGAYSSDRHRKDSPSPIGLLWMLLNCLSSAAYIIRFNKIVRATKVPSIFAAWAVNMLASPLIFTCFLVEGIKSVKTATLREILIIGLSGAAACSISVANAQAATTFSTTTVAVINALNKLPISASSVIFGLEKTGKASKWIAVFLGVAASILYAMSRAPASKAQ